MIAWTLFVNPVSPLAGHWALWLILPLLVSVAIVYKTIRTNNLKRLPLEILLLIAYMVGGLAALAGGIWLVLAIFR